MFNACTHSAVSQPAYEKKSEESSVFNCALREALKEKTGMASLSTKIVHCKERREQTDINLIHAITRYGG